MRSTAAACAGLAVILAAALGVSQQTGSGPIVTSLTLFAGTAEGLFRSTD